MTNEAKSTTQIVTIPAMDNHGDYSLHNTVTIRIPVYCPTCGAERTGFKRGLSYDGSRRLEVDTWVNGCGHSAFYSGMREEARATGLNPGYTGQADYDVRKLHASMKPAATIALSKNQPKLDSAPQEDVIRVGDYVRIMADADMENHYDLTYTQDVQAVGVVRTTGHDDLSVEFPRGEYPFSYEEIYPVDTDALHGEFEEIITEELAEAQSLIAELEARVLEVQAKNERLAAALAPFAIAGRVVGERRTPQSFTLVTTWDEECIPISSDGDGAIQPLETRHLYDAAEAMTPDDATTAPGKRDSL